MSRRVVVETDVLVAALDAGDPHHWEARGVIAGVGGCALSPYSLVELDLLIRSGNMEVRDYGLFWRRLLGMLDFYRVFVLAPSPLHLAEAGRLRDMYGLTYFDSLHAATAIVEKMALVSYDERAYGGIEGLRYVRPGSVVR